MITIPTLSELYNSILSDLETEMTVSIPLFGKVFLRALAMVQAGKLKLYYITIGLLQKNIFPDTADPESIGGTLERFGRVKLNRSPFSAVAGQYTCTVTGTTGSTIPAQTTFKSDDTSTSPGFLFVLDAAFTLSGSSGSVVLRALTAGVEAKLSVADTLTATAPIAGVNKTATVTAETVTPLAAETTEEYRTTTVEAYRLEPQGGAASDYRLWSKDAQGVKQSYAYAKSGAPNEINLYVEANIADSTDGKGTPGASILAEVEDVIEFDPDITRPLSERGRRPLGVFDVHVLAITVKEIAVTIASSTFTAAQQTAIETALETEVSKMRPYVAACDVLETKNDILDSNKLISIILSAVPGSQFGAVTFTVDAVAATTYTFINGNIPHFNGVTFS
jgi:uncharacterized phage protein gp47/JayE